MTLALKSIMYNKNNNNIILYLITRPAAAGGGRLSTNKQTVND